MNLSKTPTNALLGALPAEILQQIDSNLESVELVYNTDIYGAGDVIEYVYFPVSGIISLLAVVDTDATIEVGLVGNEGMAGIGVFLGQPTSNNRAVVQGTGFALRMTVKNFLAISDQSAELRRILNGFTFSLMSQISQSAACYRYHPSDARLAKWLLMTSDRMRSSEFQITQGFLSNMLGVRREAVNRAASRLQNSGVVSYVRGRLSILKRTELERLACTCYEISLNT